MASRQVTLIDEARPSTVDATVRADGVRLRPAEVARALGWELRPEGLCRGDVCVPVRDRGTLVDDDGIALAALARLLDRPLAVDLDAGIAVLGASAAGRAGRLAAREAPDLTLPDLEGRLHTLRDQRGKKTLLIAWASW
jgi:hypothetical protein